MTFRSKRPAPTGGDRIVQRHNRTTIGLPTLVRLRVTLIVNVDGHAVPRVANLRRFRAWGVRRFAAYQLRGLSA